MFKAAAIGTIATALVLATSAGHSATAPMTIMVVPAEKLLATPCATKPGRPVTMRFTGMKIDEDGVLKLKRVIRVHPLTAGTNPPDVGGDPLPQASPAPGDTPLDIEVGSTVASEKTDFVLIKILVSTKKGAKFLREPGTIDQAYIRAGINQQNSFCGLTNIRTAGNVETITFGIKSGQTAGFAVGIVIPEVDEDGMVTQRFLPIIVDPNVKNRG